VLVVRRWRSEGEVERMTDVAPFCSAGKKKKAAQLSSWSVRSHHVTRPFYLPGTHACCKASNAEAPDRCVTNDFHHGTVDNTWVRTPQSPMLILSSDC
jgi:hypothetical protein